MAGEIQEPFRLSFQVDSIHSGSISFGRFETEHLSWERRSSFSHNRYLEEVEKYSRTGSVTEKKAYFEAHFKRKALLGQSLPDCQNITGYQTSENNTSDSMSYRDEYEHNGGDSVHYDEENKVIECERDDKDTLYIETKSDHTPQDREVESQLETLANDISSVTLENFTPKVVEGDQVFVNINRETAVDLSCDVAQLSTDTRYDTKEDSPRVDERCESCQKGGKVVKNKFEKPRVKAFVDITQSSTKKLAGPMKGVLHGKKNEKSRPTPSMTGSIRQSLKIKERVKLEPKVIRDKSMEKKSKVKNIVEDKMSFADKVVSKACQNSHRPKVAKNLTQSEMKSSSVSFTFKSDEQAETRKEFSMKLEEKMHEKEAKRTEIQAKRQENTEAEIKTRKSLNFKATPVPSFYHEAGQRAQTKNKAISNNSRCKVQTKSPDPVHISERSSLSQHRSVKTSSKLNR